MPFVPQPLYLGGKMRKILIYDMNNWVRVKLSELIGTAPLFTLWNELVANANQKDFIFCVFDGYNSRKKRKEIYPEYKAKRKPADQSIYDGMKFFKELLKHAPQNVRTIEVPEYEADDVIANICCNMCQPEDKIDVISTDRDLTQLRKLPNVGTLKEPLVEPKWVKTYKTLVGDPSDNIKGILGFGDSAWNKLSDYAKDFLTVYFYEKFEQRDEILLDLEREIHLLLKEEVSETMYERIVTALEDGELEKWYNLVSFMPIKNEEILAHFYIGDGQVEKAVEQLSEFNMEV